MPLILNLETATDICSVCIAKGTEILSIKESEEAYSHSSAVTLLIEACVKEAGVDLVDLDAVAISAGPGSYTALRVGSSVAKGICYALGKPMIAINTLESLAIAAQKDKSGADFYVPMIDARRMEVYAEVYDQELNRVAETENIIFEETTFSEYFDQQKELVFCGNGAPKTKTLFKDKPVTIIERFCAASNLVPLSIKAYKSKSFVDIAYYSPVYFKAPNITVSRKTL